MTSVFILFLTTEGTEAKKLLNWYYFRGRYVKPCKPYSARLFGGNYEERGRSGRFERRQRLDAA